MNSWSYIAGADIRGAGMTPPPWGTFVSKIGGDFNSEFGLFLNQSPVLLDGPVGI